MKILFLNPAYGRQFCKSARWFAKSRGRVQRHPDYLCIAIAVLEKAGCNCKFIDGAAKEVSFPDTKEMAKEYRPDVVVIQGTTPSIYSDLEYAKMCKDVSGKHCLTVMVGAHSSAEPEDTLMNGGGALDIVARGEYDYTLRDIVNGKSFDDIEGISYFKGGTVFHNNKRSFIDNLDELPFPAWHHISPYDYPDSTKLYPFITLISGRGCESACTFCLFTQVMYGRRYRYRSPGRVVDEIEYDMKMFPFLKEIMFEDDTFTLARHKERLYQICEEMMRRNIKISWSANARADLTDLEVLKTMKRAGCRMLVVGFEFGSQEMLDSVRKNLTLEQMKKFAENCRKARIRIHGCFMVGGPGETRETAYETIKVARELKISTAQFSGICPYPGTEFYRWCKEKNYIVPKDWPGWVNSDLEQRAIISYPNLSVDEINELADIGLKRFYLRPSQIISILGSIRSGADLKAKWYGFRKFIQYFFSR